MEKGKFKFTKEYLVTKDGFDKSCVQNILAKKEFEQAKVFVIEDVTSNMLHIFPVKNRVPVIIALKTKSKFKKEMDDVLTRLLIYVSRMDFQAIFDSGICPKEEVCRWKGYFLVPPNQLSVLDTIKKDLKQYEVESTIIE